jgi:NADH-quinone oxidoreductase subunit F
MPSSHLLATYESAGGYAAIKKAIGRPSAAIEEQCEISCLRGRGGAGFPTWAKCGFIPKGDTGPKYLCVNADEGEPGTFKDRYLMELSPHLVLEGIVLASYALDVHTAFIYVRGEFVRAAERLRGAIKEAEAAGYLGRNILGSQFNLDVIIHMGAGAYICGEETALIESIEGKSGQPRVKPPYPATEGLFGRPTIVSNVETLASLPAIVERGGKWFASLGTLGNGGTKLYCVSGHVKKPGLFELPMGTPLKEIIFTHAGGMRSDAPLKAVIPGGISTPILLPSELNVPMDFDGLKKYGSMLGSAGVIVFDETACMVRSLARMSRFYAHESCGQCTPCREGADWLYKIVDRIERGQGREGDMELLEDVSNSVNGNTICALGDSAGMVVLGFLSKFRGEFEEHIKTGRCRFGSQPLAPVKSGRSWV